MYLTLTRQKQPIIFLESFADGGPCSLSVDPGSGRLLGISYSSLPSSQSLTGYSITEHFWQEEEETIEDGPAPAQKYSNTIEHLRAGNADFPTFKTTLYFIIVKQYFISNT